jgi:hypothetical protein
MKKLALILSTALSVCACDNQVERLAHHEKACLKAIDFGLLETADSECTSALGGPGFDSMDAHTRSERLFRLGSIKRQRAKYSEAVNLILQTLAVEEESSNSDTFEIARRHYELSLALAGQEKWKEGVVFVETLLPNIDKFPATEHKAIINMANIYITNLKKNHMDELTKNIEMSIQK